jgi:hypothetical protein
VISEVSWITTSLPLFLRPASWLDFEGIRKGKADLEELVGSNGCSLIAAVSHMPATNTIFNNRSSSRPAYPVFLYCGSEQGHSDEMPTSALHATQLDSNYRTFDGHKKYKLFAKRY